MLGVTWFPLHFDFKKILNIYVYPLDKTLRLCYNNNAQNNKVMQFICLNSYVLIKNTINIAITLIIFYKEH